MAQTAPAWTSDEHRRQLAEELRRARKIAGLSGRELAEKINSSQSTVSRIESGVAVPSMREVRAWVEAVQASDETRQLLLLLTEATHTTVSRWQTELRGRPHLQGDVEKTERNARRIRTFQPSVVPGLLQTAEYTRQVFEMFQEPAYTPERLMAAVAGRMERQMLLYDLSRVFEFLITEAALRWRPGTQASLAAQIDRVCNLSTLSNVRLGVLPFAAQAIVPYTHAFTIYEPRDDDGDVLTNVEMIHANIQIIREVDVSAFQRRWMALERSAVHGDDARRFLHHLAHEIRVSDD